MERLRIGTLGAARIAPPALVTPANRRIGWEPVLTAASRPEDQADIGDRAEHRWCYELTPQGTGSTLVTETFDCSRSPEWLRRAVKGGTRWVDSMTRTLEKLDVLSPS
jgi:hypothetical protein